MNKDAQTRKLTAAYGLLKVLCEEVSDTMPVRQALAFVSVALRSRNGGVADVADVAKDTKSGSAIASRDLLVLGKRGRNGAAGHGLIVVKEDYSDLRRRPYVLSSKGEELVTKLLQVVEVD